MILTPRPKTRGRRQGADKDKCIICEKLVKVYGHLFCERCKRKTLTTKLFYYNKYARKNLWYPRSHTQRKK